MKKIDKVCLGTAQLGMNYGITNSLGRPSQMEANEILDLARKNNIRFLDTATNYGDSQKIIGFYSKNNHFKISTKLPLINIGDVKKDLSDQINNSLTTLKRTQLEYCFLHNPMQLLNQEGNLIWKSLIEAREQSLISKIGFSLYDTDDLSLLLEKSYRPDVIQVPYNVLDRRFADSGLLDEMKSLGIEIHVRSIFLQGLLLMDNESLPKKFLKHKKVWIKFEKMLLHNGISKLDFLLHYIFDDKRVDKVVIGVTCKEELMDIISSLKSNNEVNLIDFKINNIDRSLIDPRLW